MELALKDAGITPDKIGYVSGHGTATEKRRYCRNIGDRGRVRIHPHEFAKKATSAIHSACGALNLVHHRNDEQRLVCADRQFENIDPRCGKVDYIQQADVKFQTDYVVSNNFAFGGVNTSLVFKRWQNDNHRLIS